VKNAQAGGLRILEFGRRLLLRGCCLGGLGAGEDGVVGGGAREENGEADGTEHEDDGGVGGQLGEEVGCATGAEGCLGALAAEGSGEVGGFALLEEDDADDEERDDDVKSDEKTDQHSACNLLDPEVSPEKLCGLVRWRVSRSHVVPTTPINLIKCIIGFLLSPSFWRRFRRN
jgi:hypothetical protein